MGNCTTPSLFLEGTIPTSRQPTILDCQNITLDGTIFILCNTNIICECTFVTFSGSLIFFSYLMVSSLHCVVPTSHATILLSYSVVLFFFFFFFSHLMVSSSHSAIPKSHMTVLLSHLVVPLFFFSHLRYHPYIVQYQHHI